MDPFHETYKSPSIVYEKIKKRNLTKVEGISFSKVSNIYYEEVQKNIWYIINSVIKNYWFFLFVKK